MPTGPAVVAPGGGASDDVFGNTPNIPGMGQTVLVQGEAGIGKSLLCYQMREQIGDQPHTWLECRCSPYATGTPFRPVIELMEQALTFQTADTPADKLGKLQTGLERGGF